MHKRNTWVTEPVQKTPVISGSVFPVSFLVPFFRTIRVEKRKMASRGRKKRVESKQKTTLMTFFKADNSSESIVKSILIEIVNFVTDNSCASCSKVKCHAGEKVTKKTITEWMKKYPWLDVNDKHTNLRCTQCTKMKSKLLLKSVWANEGSPNIQISGIIRHDQSIEHTSACAEEEKQKGRDILEANIISETPVSLAREDAIVFNTVYYAAKSEIPSNSVNGLLELLTKVGINVKYTNLSWDSITEMQNAISHVLQDELINDIKKSEIFAIMLDESTDVTVQKRLSICIRYVKAGEPLTKMLCNVHVDDGCAHTIMNTVVQEFERLDIDLSKCTSLATDGAASMMGKHKGVGKQLISKYSPFCVQTHCIAHRINLACTDSIKKNDYMIKFRDKFSSLYLFINASSIRTLALKNIQKLLQEPEITVKEPYSIRWLGLRNAVSAVYESFGSVLTTLSKFAAEKNPVAKGLFKYFASYKVAMVIALVLDVHNELAVLTCEMQKKNLLFSEIKPLMDSTLSKLTCLETKDGECISKMKTQLRKTDDGAFYGEEKVLYNVNMDSEFESVRKDYINRLKKNFANRFRKEDSAVFEDFSKLFEPSLVNSFTEEICVEAVESLASFYGYEKTVKIVSGDMIEGTEEQTRAIDPLLDPHKLQDEWPRLYGMIKGTYATLSTDILCKRIILLHRTLMPNIAKLAAIALCLQTTSVECERSFSTQNRLKDKHRASLGSEKLNTLMLISMLGPSVPDYDPSTAVAFWMKQKNRRKSRLFTDFKPRPAKKQKT